MLQKASKDFILETATLHLVHQSLLLLFLLFGFKKKKWNKEEYFFLNTGSDMRRINGSEWSLPCHHLRWLRQLA